MPHLSLFPPALVFYTDKLPGWVGGRANGPIIRIRTRYKENKGIHAHEYFHVWQWWLTAFTHPLLYLLIRPYRQWSEVMAYRIQLKHSPQHLDHFAKALSAKYKLRLSPDAAKQLLSN